MRENKKESKLIKLLLIIAIFVFLVLTIYSCFTHGDIKIWIILTLTSVTMLLLYIANSSIK